MFRKLIFLTERIIKEAGSQASFIFVLNNNVQSIFTGINGSLSINVLTCFGLSKSNISETIICILVDPLSSTKTHVTVSLIMDFD